MQNSNLTCILWIMICFQISMHLVHSFLFTSSGNHKNTIFNQIQCALNCKRSKSFNSNFTCLLKLQSFLEALFYSSSGNHTKIFTIINKSRAKTQEQQN